MSEIKKENPLEMLPINKLLVKFSVPSIIAMLVTALYNIVDQFFIGQAVGSLGNAATSISFPLSITLYRHSIVVWNRWCVGIQSFNGSWRQKNGGLLYRKCCGNVIFMRTCFMYSERDVFKTNAVIFWFIR